MQPINQRMTGDSACSHLSMPVEVDQNATTVRSTDFTRITTKGAFAAKHFGLQLGQRTS